MIRPPGPAEVARFQALVADRLGLATGAAQHAAMAELLLGRAEAARGPVGAYLDALAEGPADGTELMAIAEALTVGESHFFRAPDQWRAFAEVVLPALAAVAAGGRRPRLLSAGCATGEEAYTMAIVVRDAWPGPPAMRPEIVAVDVNPRFLAQARQARYTAWALRGVGEAERRRAFRADGRWFHLDPAVRELVAFEARNLVADDPGFWRPGAFDAIFCRNVAIYFDDAATGRLLARFAQALAPGGFLFMGAAESLRGRTPDFQLRQACHAFFYQRGAGGAPPVPSAAAAPPRPSPPAPPPPDDAWFAAIGAAAERIARLAGPPAARPPGVAPPGAAGAAPAPAWHAGEAMAHFRAERFGEALAALAGASGVAARTPGVALLRAAAELNLGDARAAAATCEAVLARDPHDPGAHCMLALALAAAGDGPGATRHHEAAIRADARFAMPHLHLGLLAQRRGDAAAAGAALGRAAALLADEEPERITLFGGGFAREALQALSEAGRARCGGAP